MYFVIKCVYATTKWKSLVDNHLLFINRGCSIVYRKMSGTVIFQESYKNKPYRFLTSVPDKLSLPNYIQSAASNSQLDQVEQIY